MLANFTALNNALNSYWEFSYVRSQLQEKFSDKTREVHFVKSSTTRTSLNGLPNSYQSDEFNHNSTEHNGDLAPIVTAALDEIIKDRKFHILRCPDYENCKNVVENTQQDKVIVTVAPWGPQLSNNDAVLEIKMDNARLR
jgi:hypothetical protein